MEAQVHELTIHVQERRGAVEGQRRGQLHHAYEHQRSDLPCPTGHGEDDAGQDARSGGRQQDVADRLPLRGPRGEGGFAHAARDGRQGFLGGDDDHREGHQGEGQGAPEQPAGAEHRRVVVVLQLVGEEQLVDRTAEHVDEEAEAEDAEDDGGHAGEVVDADAHDAQDGALLGVLAEIDGGDDAEGRHQQAHEDRHHERTEDGRHQAAFGVGFTRLVEDEFAEPGHEEFHAAPGVETVREPCADDLGEGHDDFATGGVLRDERGDRPALDDLLGLGLQGGEPFLQSGDLLSQGRDLVGELEVFGPAEGHAGLVHLAVHVTDAVAGDLDQLLADHRGGGDFGLESIFEGGIRGRDKLAVRLTQGLRTDESGTVLDALEPQDVGRERLSLDLGFVDPKVGITVQFAEADLILQLVARLAGRRTRADATLGELTDDRPTVVDLRDRHLRRPEDRDAVQDDQGEEADDHAQADDEPQAREPDEGFAARRAAVGGGGHGQTTL